MLFSSIAEFMFAISKVYVKVNALLKIICAIMVKKLPACLLGLYRTTATTDR